MDFGKILEEWESHRERGEARGDMNDWLESYPPPEREEVADEGNPRREAALRRQALRAMKPQRTLDLHGLRAVEATESVEAFLRECSDRGLQKVLIIHGKGRHSTRPVLPAVIRRCLDESAIAGEYGAAKRESGGSGALWVILKAAGPGSRGRPSTSHR